jgi:phosphate transport system substrate-binding protein
MTARRTFKRLAALLGTAVLAMGVAPVGVAHSEDYQRISGEGSSWAANAISDMQAVVLTNYDMKVDYAATGSTAGRQRFLDGTVDFAASDIPFQFHPEDTSSPENPAPGSYAYIPVVAGGTAFMYNLRINGQRVTNLRLSGVNVAKIFAGDITMWNDPALQADNPGLVLPGRTIVPVVRSDGSGSTAQFTMWMINRHPDIWSAYCQKSRPADKCGFTSLYPTGPGMIAQSGDSGVAQYVSQSYAEGAIGYVNYSYALNLGFPVVKVLNAAGYYTEPTPKNVAVSLLRAKINEDASDPAVYLTQNLDEVYSDTDPRNYQLSSYSYFILPTAVRGQFNAEKGKTVAAFAKYAMCEAQQKSESLGYSPMPINLVEASFNQIRKIPGADVGTVDIQDCNNPTFSSDGHNVLADEAPMPPACDKQGIPTQCEFGTVGLDDTTVSGGGSSYSAGGGQNPGGGGTQNTDPGATQNTDPGATQNTDPGATQNTDPGATQNTDPGGNTGGGSVNSSTSTTAPCVSTSTSSSTSPSSSTAGSVTASTAATTTTIDPCATTVPPQTSPSGSVAPAGDAVCDADTGVCGPVATAALVSGNVEADVPSAAGPVRTSTLDNDSGWGLAQTLMVVVVLLLTAAIIVVPSVVWRRFSVGGTS